MIHEHTLFEPFLLFGPRCVPRAVGGEFVWCFGVGLDRQVRLATGGS
jgi:hypothetical protein